MTDDWDVKPVPLGVIAIGDLHGDVRAFGAIARACGLIDGDGAWSGGAAHLVLMGDLVGGPRSRLLLGAIMRLEREASIAGGRIHSLLGNHDLLAASGRTEKMSRDELRLYGDDEFRAGTLAAWVRTRPTIVKIGDTVFVHAGLDRWALETSPAELNARVRAWIAHLQGNGDRPPKSTRWMIDDDGPLWTRAFKTGRGKKDGPSKKLLVAILDSLGARRVVLGHSPTKGSGIVLEHPRYGSAVVLVDTRISDDERGKLAALVITRDALSPVYALERDAGKPLETREAKALQRPVREEEREGADDANRADEDGALLVAGADATTLRRARRSRAGRILAWLRACLSR